MVRFIVDITYSTVGQSPLRRQTTMKGQTSPILVHEGLNVHYFRLEGVKATLCAAEALNTSWQQAIQEISGALMKEVGILQAKLEAANAAVEKIAKERDRALQAIQLAKAFGLRLNADNPEFQGSQNAGYSSGDPSLSPDGP